MSIQNLAVLSAQDPVDALMGRLSGIVEEFHNVALASSLGAEDMVLTDAILTRGFPIAIFTLDTGRLPNETLDLLVAIRGRYGYDIEAVRPQAAAVERYVSEHGLNAFYESIELRKRCCHLRKVESLARALAGRHAWVTGLRRAQSGDRSTRACRHARVTRFMARRVCFANFAISPAGFASPSPTLASKSRSRPSSPSFQPRLHSLLIRYRDHLQADCWSSRPRMPVLPEDPVGAWLYRRTISFGCANWQGTRSPATCRSLPAHRAPPTSPPMPSSG